MTPIAYPRDYTNGIACPHCGRIIKRERANIEKDKFTCNNCGRQSWIDSSTTYTTTPIFTPRNCPKCGDITYDTREYYDEMLGRVYLFKCLSCEKAYMGTMGYGGLIASATFIEIRICKMYALEEMEIEDAIIQVVSPRLILQAKRIDPDCGHYWMITEKSIDPRVIINGIVFNS